MLNDVKKMFAMAMLCIAIPAFADDAPVYDADNYPPQFDGQPYSNNGPIEPEMRPEFTPPQPRPEYVPPAPPQPTLSFEQRLTRAEHQINNMQHSTASNQVDSLQNEVQTLRNQIEELTHQVQQLQNQQRAMYTDMDSRISKLPTNISSTKNSKMMLADEDSVNSKSSAQPKTNIKKSSTINTAMVNDARAKATLNQPNVAEEQQVYQTAYDLIKAKKYNEAIVALKKMLQKYPSGQFAANAHYWLGELYGLLNKNAESAAEFAIIVKDYPKSPKVSDAELKLGLIYVAESKWQDAKGTFKKIINHYPGSASARLASEQLKQIKMAGH